MMRSDMPKQVMAYRNGGGLPSLATVPMETNISGEPHQLSYITPFEANLLRGLGGSGTPGPGGVPQYAGVYEKLFGKPFSDTKVGQALGMQHSGTPPGFSPAEDAAMAGSPSSPMSAQEKFDSNPARQASIRSKKRRKKRRARRAAAEAAAAEQQAAANVDGGIMTLDPNVGATDPDVINAYIANILERDDLSSVEKLEFAQSLADTYGVAGQSGMQTVTNSLSSAALDPTSGLSNQERVDTLTSLSPYTDTDYSGLIDTLNNQMAINTIATTTPGADVINNITSTTPSPNLTDTLTTVPEPVSYAQYSPIVPAQNIVPSGIMGLPSSNSYNFTSYVPETFTPAVNSLVLPPLG